MQMLVMRAPGVAPGSYHVGTFSFINYFPRL
nr:MAG TPA: hypothetical protein [Caudoviricetes sp.]